MFEKGKNFRARMWFDVNLFKTVKKEIHDTVMFDLKKVSQHNEIELKQAKSDDLISGVICEEEYSLSYSDYKLNSLQIVVETKDKLYYYSVSRVNTDSKKYNQYPDDVLVYILLNVLLEDNSWIDLETHKECEVDNIRVYIAKKIDSLLKNRKFPFDNIIKALETITMFINYNNNEYVAYGNYHSYNFVKFQDFDDKYKDRKEKVNRKKKKKYRRLKSNK